MALTPIFASKIMVSTTSITDVVAFHAELRDIEASDEGMLYPTIHTYKEVQLGGGSIFPAVAFVNGWTLQFMAGNFEIKGGNIDVTINPVANCYIRQTQSAAYAVTSIGAGGATPEQISDAVWANVFAKKLLTVAKFMGLK